MFCDISAVRRGDAKTRSRFDPDEEDDHDNGDDRRSMAQIAADHKRSMARLYDELDRELEAEHRNVMP
jgi:hypothetical protein